jgi:O-antigen ligase
VALLSVAMIIQPVVVLFLLLPVVVVLFWLAPAVRSYPKVLLSLLFFCWLAVSVLWPQYLSLNLSGLPSIKASRAVLIVLIVIWLFYMMNSLQMKQNLSSIYMRNSKVFALLLLLVLTRVFSLFFSEAPFQSLFSFMKDFIEVFLPILILLSIFSFKEDLDRLLLVFAVTGAGVVCLSLLEIIMNKNIFLFYLPAGFVVSSEFIEQSLKETVRTAGLRVKGPFSHPLLLAQFLVVILPVYAYFIFTHTKKTVRICSLILIPLIVFILYKTGSRSSFVGIAVEALVLSVLYLKWVSVTKKASALGWIVIVSYPILILVAFFVFYLTMDFFVGQTAGEISSTNARFIMWDRGLSLVLNSPVFGFGSGSAAYVLGFFSNGTLTIDSYFLSILLNYGYLGLILFIAYFIFIFYIGLKLMKENVNNAPILILILSSISGYLTVALILSTAHNLHILFIFSALILLLATKPRLNMV